MSVLDQLGIDSSFFIQFGVFFVVFLIIPQLFFKPFQRLVELRLQKTQEDRVKAEELTRLANEKFGTYREKIQAERQKVRGEYEKLLGELKTQEAQIIGEARAEAKVITQKTVDELQSQSQQLKRTLEADVEGLALALTETLVKRQS